MAVQQVGPHSLRVAVRRNGSTVACFLLVLAVPTTVSLDQNLPLALYLLSFWHYYLYWLAFTFRAMAFDVFKRDAVVMKSISVAALAFAYLYAPIDPVSLAVIAGGILLNLRAATVLGVDRTYYGHEVAGLPPRRIDAFPYSLTAHPMILGNVAAFGGTLINPAFRAEWWPLAALHVVLNIGLLVMELAGVGHGRAVGLGGGLVLAGVLFAAVLATTTDITLAVVLAVAAAVTCAAALYRRYTRRMP